MTLDRSAVPSTASFEPSALPAGTRVLRRIDDLDVFREAWDRLAASSGSPMQQYAWARASAACFGAGQELRVAWVGPAGQARAIALLAANPRSGHLAMPGVEQVYEPTDLVYANAAAAAALAGALAKTGWPLFLPRVFADSPVVAAVTRAFAGKGLVMCRPASACPFIPLDAGWTDPERQFASGRRSDLRRYRRRAEELGPVSTEVLAPSKPELGVLLEEAFRVEAANWKGRRGTALACNTAMRAFYREYAAAACESGSLRICFLRIGREAVAVQIALEYDRSFWLLKIGYDERYARCSPGVLLMLETVRHAASRGLRSCEMLGTSAPWVRMWTHHQRPCVSLRAYPWSVRGVQAFAIDLLRLSWRRRARRRSGQP
jgi:CelD/BcsL family acetyltransferase involved in cellulose biosynthesis